MTATLDLLERRGWIRRVPNPADRRSVLIEITPEGRATTDRLLPGIRTVEQNILSALTHDERAHLLDLLAKILTRTAKSPPNHSSPSTASATGPAAHPPARRRARSPANPRHQHSHTPGHGRRTPRNPRSHAARPTRPSPDPRCT